MSKQDIPPGRWTTINFGWKYWNYVIIGVGLIVGFCVWVLPNKWADPEVAGPIAERSRLQRQAKQWQAEQDAIEKQIAKENEENGLVYIEPGTNPFLPPASTPAPAEKK
jgi:hypothetical protein